MSTKIYIDNDGNIHGLADDTIDKLEIGEKKVQRVSNIEFDHKAQVWVATDLDDNVIAFHPVRSRVIEMERAYFNNQLEELFAKAVTV